MWGSFEFDAPVAVDCDAEMRWLERNCPAEGHGVEWDWMNFLWHLNTAQGHDLRTIGRLLSPVWAVSESRAYDLGTAAGNAFADAGRRFGVDF